MLVLLAVGVATASGGAVSARRELHLTAVAIDSAHIRLGWSRLPGATSYRVSRGRLAIAVTAHTRFVDSLLWPATRYRYTVTALASTGGTAAAAAVAARTRRLPPAGFPQPLPRASVWYQPVRGATTAADSPRLVAYLAAHAGRAALTLHKWGVAVAEARPGAPRYRIPCTAGWRCTLDAFGAVPVPLIAQPDPSGDGHLAVYDPGRKLEWDMWRAARTASGWTAASGASFRLVVDARSSPAAGADAANFPLLAGLVRPEEILQRHIDHALVIGVPGIGKGPPVCPAAHSVQTTNSPDAPREGQRIQLDPSLDVPALPIPGWEKTVARALQRYGAYVRDDSGALAVYAENPVSRGYDAWAKIGLGRVDSVSLAGIPWTRVRFLAAPDWPHCG